MASRSPHAAAFLLCLALGAYGFPFSPYRHIKASRPVGYDPDFKSDGSGTVPAVQVLGYADLELNNASNPTAPLAEPLVLNDPEEDGDDDALQKRFIDGTDDRYLFANNTYPFNAVGKLQWSNGVFCSGALVGPRHILTAKHCIVSTGAAATFSPGFDTSAPDGSARVQHIITSTHEWGTPCGWKGDWAVMILDQRLGDTLGFFGVKLPDPSRIDQPIFRHVGYPGDKDRGTRPYRVDGNPIELQRTNFDCDGTGPYYTDTDCAGGQSGGPHWEKIGRKRYIWGTLSVTFDGGNGEAWAGWGSGDEMVHAVVKARRDYA